LKRSAPEILTTHTDSLPRVLGKENIIAGVDCGFSPAAGLDGLTHASPRLSLAEADDFPEFFDRPFHRWNFRRAACTGPISWQRLGEVERGVAPLSW
jgi:hypothetical protein